MGGWGLKNENYAFLSNIVCQLYIFGFLVITNLDQDPGYEFTKKPGSGSESGSETISFPLLFLTGGLRGSTSKKEVIILDLPAAYRGAITIIKGNESNPPVCKDPTQQECLPENGTVLINVFLLHLSEVQVPKELHGKVEYMNKVVHDFSLQYESIDTVKIEAHWNLTPIVIFSQRLKDENEENFMLLRDSVKGRGQLIYEH